MKKSMIFLLCMVSVLVSLVYGMNEQYNDYLKLDSIDKQRNFFTVRIDETDIAKDEFLEEMYKISSQYNASIIRSEIVDTENQSIMYKAGVFTDEYLQFLNQFISEGTTLKKDTDVLSTFSTKDQNQVGTIHDLFDDDPTIVMSLKSYLNEPNKSLAGTYTICCEKDDKDFIVKDMASFFHQDTKNLLQPNFFKTISRGPVEIFIAASLILLMIYTLMCLFYPTSQIKKIGVLKLLGFKIFDIWKILILTNIVVFFAFVCISIIIQKIFIPSIDLFYICKLLGLQAGVLFISVFLSAFMMLVVKRYTLNSIVKGFFHVKASLAIGYGLKMVTFMAMLLVIPYLTDTVHLFLNQLAVKSAYEKTSNQMALVSYHFVGNEFQELLDGNSDLNDRFLEMFQELEETAGAQYFSILDYEGYPILNINENGLQRYQNWFDTSVSDYFQSDQLVVLVPSVYKDDSKMDDIYRQIALTMEDEDMTFDVRYYSANAQLIFTENQQMIDEGKAFIENPIFVCLHGKYLKTESYMFQNNNSMNPIRIENTSDNKQAIDIAVKNAGLQNNSLEFDSILNTGFKEYIKVIQLGMSIVAIGLVLITLVDVLASYYILLILLVTRNKEIFVKKMLGHSLFERYKNELFYFTVLYIACIVQLLITGQDVLSLIIFAGLMLMDVLTMYIMVRFKERKNLHLILKGEE